MAHYIEGQLHDLPLHAANSLAASVGVSRAAVVRLAIRLGYDGFADLRERARAELRSDTTSPLVRFKPDERSSPLDRRLRRDN